MPEAPALNWMNKSHYINDETLGVEVDRGSGEVRKKHVRGFFLSFFTFVGGHGPMADVTYILKIHVYLAPSSHYDEHTPRKSDLPRSFTRPPFYQLCQFGCSAFECGFAKAILCEEFQGTLEMKKGGQ